MEQHAVAFVLVLSRLGGLFVFAPMLASSAVPVRVRAVFAVMFGAALYPTMSSVGIPAGPIDMASLLPMVCGEALLGLCIGLLAAMPMFSVQLAGLLMSQQMGIGLAGTYNPALETESDVFGELLMYMAFGVFVAAGGLDSMFVAVAGSFGRVPLGGFACGMAPLDLLTGLVQAGTELALRVCAPVLGIIFIETFASAIIMKTIPQINIMSIGFALKIVLGMTGLVTALATIEHVISAEVLEGAATVLRWVESLPGGW